MRALVLGAVGAFLAGVSLAAAQTLPEPIVQEMLIKTSILTFNDANLTGNYAVLHAKMSKPVRDQNSPDKLKQIFKSFVDQHIDMSIIAAKPPIATSAAEIDKRGALLLRGYFDVKPARVSYELDFIPSDGEWKLLGLGVNVKPESSTASK
jgi:hypothetical protein